MITEAGDLPNVTGLVYVAAFAPDAGESLATISAAHPAVAGDTIAPDSDGHLWIAQDLFHESFCQDLPEDEALVMAVTQKAPLGAAYVAEASEPAWRTKPSWYQVSTEDRMIDPDNQRRMAARTNPRKTIELVSSHASLASHPTEIVDLIEEASRA